MTVLRETENFELHAFEGTIRVYNTLDETLSCCVDDLDAEHAITVAFDTDFDDWAAGQFN